ncbi:MAG: clan AA aspartic protease, partial [Alistipes sp.]|nr:clan AA aspartic protease [Alistipes sp.]
IPVERRPIGRGEHLIVKATVGDVSEDFIFDTGCSHANFISREVAERLGVEIVADSIITQGVGGSGYVQLGVLPEMRLGDVVIKNPTFLVAEHLVPEHVEVEGMCDAVLGTHVIRKLGEVRYERSASRMVLPSKPGAAAERNIVCDNGTYYLVCHQTGEQLLLHFDTGNVKSQLSSRYFTRFQRQVEAEGGDVERSRSGGFGGVVWNDVRTLPSVELQVGSKRVMLQQVAVDMPNGTPPMNYDGAVGVDLLTASERVSFDLDKMYYRIDK